MERRQLPRTSRSRNIREVYSLGFFVFVFVVGSDILNVVLQKLQDMQTRNVPKKACSLSSQRMRKGQPSKKDDFQIVITLTQPNITEKSVGPHHRCQQRPSRDPRLLPAPTYSRVTPPPHQCGVGEGQVLTLNSRPALG